MATRKRNQPRNKGHDNRVPYRGGPDELPPAADDPGGSHAKGYSADPLKEEEVPAQEPIPLVSDGEVHGHVRKPDQSHAVEPGKEGGYAP